MQNVRALTIAKISFLLIILTWLGFAQMYNSKYGEEFKIDSDNDTSIVDAHYSILLELCNQIDLSDEYKNTKDQKCELNLEHKKWKVPLKDTSESFLKRLSLSVEPDSRGSTKEWLLRVRSSIESPPEIKKFVNELNEDEFFSYELNNANTSSINFIYQEKLITGNLNLKEGLMLFIIRKYKLMNTNNFPVRNSLTHNIIRINGINIKNAGEIIKGKLDFKRAMYYSGVTMLTIGYGDVKPVTTAVRLLSLLEGALGLLLFAILGSAIYQLIKGNINEIEE